MMIARFVAFVIACALTTSLATAQLADGQYTATDTMNPPATGTVTANTRAGGTIHAIRFIMPGQWDVQLAWDAQQQCYVAGTEKRFEVVTVHGVIYYWYKVKDAQGNWQTLSSGVLT